MRRRESHGPAKAGDDLDDEEVVEEEVDHDKPMLNLVASPSPIERRTPPPVHGQPLSTPHSRASHQTF